MTPVSEWMKKRTRKKQEQDAQYLSWGNGDSIGRAADGTIVVMDEDGLCLIAMEECEWLSDEVLHEITTIARAEDATKETEDSFWQRNRVSLDEGKAMPIEVMTVAPAPPSRAECTKGPIDLQINGAHKRKGVKVEPVDDSGQPSRTIEGRLDWKERAAAKQVPNKGSNSAPFSQYFEPRYAPFPRGTRLTPERISEMKISPDLLPKEREMLFEVLYRREAALAWDFRELGRVSKDVILLVVINTVLH
jgi:hypothetical protein